MLYAQAEGEPWQSSGKGAVFGPVDGKGNRRKTHNPPSPASSTPPPVKIVTLPEPPAPGLSGKITKSIKVGNLYFVSLLSANYTTRIVDFVKG